MKLIKPQTPEYNDCLRAMIRMRRMGELRAVRRLPDTPLQIVNEGTDNEVAEHPLNFALYRAGDTITLFGLNIDNHEK